MRTRIIYTLLFIVLHLTSFSETENFYFKRITSSEGLSNSWVRCFYQDDLGFIWIGTADGLNRYDGINLKTYRPLINNNTILGDLTINDIIKKDNQHLWIATDIGLCLFNFVTEELTPDTLLYGHPVLAITSDSNRNFWFGTNHGLYRYNTDSKDLKSFTNNTYDKYSLSNDYVNVLKIDSENNLWAGTKGGINLFNPTTNTFTQFVQNDETNHISSNDITSICEDKNHRLWVGTALNGLNLLEKTNGKMHFEKVIDGAISSLFANKKHLWIGSTNGQGIQLLDLDEFSKGKIKTLNLHNDPLVKTSISENSVFCIYADNLNDIWIGTYGNGINYYSPRSKPFNNVSEKYASNTSIKNNLVNVFFEEDNFLWIGTEAGLDRQNKKTGIFEHYQHESNRINSLGANPIYSIFKDSRGNLWVGGWSGGLNKFDYNTNSFKRFLPDGKPGSIGSANVFSIFEDSYNNLWIGTTIGGLNRFNYKTETFSIYKRNPNDTTSFSGRSMNCIMQTKSGDLYISTFSNIERYNYEKDNFEHIFRSKTQQGSIITMFEDSHNNFWLGTNAGLELYNPITNTFKSVTTADGLPDNTIQSIIEDDHGNLWLGTNHGLSKFIGGSLLPEKPLFWNFSTADGLPANDFKKRAAYKNKDGYLYFGSSNGYTYFHPDSIKINTDEPKLVFTNFQILETKPNENSKYRSLQTNLNLSNNIKLNYPNTNFIIGFASLNYLNSKKNKFKYMLEGFDTDWIDAGETNTATYTNLVEGEYTFKVIGTNNDGTWKTDPIEITINIYPPWWKSFLFKLILFISLLLISVIVIVIRFTLLNKENKILEIKVEKRTNELTKLNSLLEEKQTKITTQNTELERHRNQLEELVEERTIQLVAARAKAEESDRLKSAFLANMSHEIRTPMNAIIGFSSILSDSKLSEEKRHKYIDHIRTNGKMLTVLINDIIDISIIEANQMILSKSKFNVDTILKELYNLYDLEKNREIKLSFTKSEQGADLYLFNDAIRFRQIMVNLLTNAFKYSDRGTIEYGYEICENEVKFFITDTGIGIEQDELTKIFDHFYKTNKEKTKLYRGTGIGLAICKKLIEQMGGIIWVESKIQVGTTFYFTMPFNQAI